MFRHKQLRSLGKFVALITLALGIVVGVGGSASALSRPTPVYRLFNKVSGQHLFTSDANENTVLQGNPVWVHETETFLGHASIGGNTGSCESGLVPVYRIVSSRSGEHLLTADMNEVTFWTGSTHGWWYSEGIGFCASASSGNGLVSVYRLFNSVSGEHLLTADQNEVNALNGHYNWGLEANGRGGVVFYAEPSN